MDEYANKAQQMLRGRSASPEVARKQPKEADFPAVPKEDFVKQEEPIVKQEEPVVKEEEPVAKEEEPLIAA